MPQEDITQTTPSMVAPAKLEKQTSADEPCSPPGPRPNVGRPAEAGARWITERKDDPEEEGPQSNDETAEKSPQSDDETAEQFAKAP